VALIHLWRISNHLTLDGDGGMHTPGRWHSEGRRIIYLAESPAGALVEALVHLEVDAAAPFRNYTLLKVELPGPVPAVGAKAPGESPAELAASRAVGDAWLAAKQDLLLRVPSAIVPETFNVLLNPVHRDATRARVVWHGSYPWHPQVAGRRGR